MGHSKGMTPSPPWGGGGVARNVPSFSFERKKSPFRDLTFTTGVRPARHRRGTCASRRRDRRTPAPRNLRGWGRSRQCRTLRARRWRGRRCRTERQSLNSCVQSRVEMVSAQEKSSKKSSFFCKKCLDSVNGARVQWGIPRGYPLPPPRGGGGGEQIPCQGGWHSSCCVLLY